MNTMRVIFSLIIMLTFFVCGYAQINNENTSSNEIKSSLFSKNIYLEDGELYNLNFDFMNSSFDFKNKYHSTPIVIRSFEDDISTFTVLRSYTTDNLPEIHSFYNIIGDYSLYSTNKYLIYKDNPFPSYKIDRNGGNPDHDAFQEKNIQAWTYGTNYLLPFFHRIMKSASARKEVYQYITQTFQNVSTLLPISVKKKIIDICKKLQLFLADYKINSQKYRNLSEKGNLHLSIGYMQSFLFRRIVTDKIPINELSQFIISFQTLVENELKSSSVDYYFRININNSDLIICDGTSSNYSIFSKQSPKRIDLNNLVSIKCIKSDINNYLIKYDGKEILYNNKLEVIKTD